MFEGVSRIYTVGHSSRSIEEFLELLRAWEIARLVDVRRYPGSRRHPHFARQALHAHLAGVGIDYAHEAGLGGRREGLDSSPNGWWRNAQLRAYADHTASEEFREALARVLERAGGERTALMCAEAVPWRCHRQLIADVLAADGHEVRHLLALDREHGHTPSEAARRGPRGEIIWPASDQLGLF